MASEKKVGKKLAEGKTKVIRSTSDPDVVLVHSKDDVTAGNGAKHDVIPGKGSWSTITTCNAFMLLDRSGIETAFLERVNLTDFLAQKCDMIPLEVVCRREDHGSSLKRKPWVAKGTVEARLLVEFYLKTSGQRWMGKKLPEDDMLAIATEDGFDLYRTDRPVSMQKKFMHVYYRDVGVTPEDLVFIEQQTRLTFLVMEKAWSLVGRKLVDFKVEYGWYTRPDGRRVILLSDVLDSDSWRLTKNGEYQDKQVYRDGGPLDMVASKFATAAVLSSQFGIPDQAVILWTGSEKDDSSAFTAAFEKYAGQQGKFCRLIPVCRSMHKQPERGLEEIDRLIEDYPNSVVVTGVGLSNGAGPLIAARVPVPVFSVPTSDIPTVDIWSSLRMPSDVPNATILSPANAMLAALKVLALSNPALYAHLRLRQEELL